MDLIYMNEQKEDIGIMKDYTLDIAYGADENDFECTIISRNHCCKAGYFLYVEGTEYGGIIDDISSDTKSDTVSYSGRTWHGILNSKVIEPDNGQAYLTLSGEANTVISSLLTRLGLQTFFQASTVDSEITIPIYKMDRYIRGYDGIRKMLKSVGAKLIITFREGMAVLSAKPIHDYSNDEQFDTDQISFIITKHFNPINHVICLGSGELENRTVIHLYSDSNGNISETQLMTGIDEVTKIYDYPNTESVEELIKGGTKIIKDSWNSNEIKYDFNSNDKAFDIGDIVGAVEFVTGIEVNAEITKKIVTINNNTQNISYKVGE